MEPLAGLEQGYFLTFLRPWASETLARHLVTRCWAYGFRITNMDFKAVFEKVFKDPTPKLQSSCSLPLPHRSSGGSTLSAKAAGAKSTTVAKRNLALSTMKRAVIRKRKDSF